MPLDISYPETLLTSVIDEVGSAVICTTSEHAKSLPGILKFFGILKNFKIIFCI